MSDNKPKTIRERKMSGPLRDSSLSDDDWAARRIDDLERECERLRRTAEDAEATTLHVWRMRSEQWQGRALPWALLGVAAMAWLTWWIL